VELAAAVRPKVDRIRAEIVAQVDAERGWSERMTSPKVRSDLMAATSAVLSRFVALIGTDDATFGARDRALFRELGAGEAREGRGLEDLLAAYRVGTRVIYATVAAELAGLDSSPAAQVALGEAVFALVDALQAESAEGYSHETATHAGERERRLRRLLEALLAGDQASGRAVAAQVGWMVPKSVAVVLVPAEVVAPARGAVASGGFVVERDGTGVIVLDADHAPDPVLDRLAGVPGLAVAPRVGPSVPLPQARRSWANAQLLPELPGTTPVRVADWLPELLCRGAADVAATIVERTLEPLASLRRPQRERLTATLRAWLTHWGQRLEIAAELGIHPQTVAYRVNQLRELFGDDLDDPRWRLAAQLALLAAPGPATGA
jgi:hypothetical protein